MKRVEIIANHSIQSDVFEALKLVRLDKRYTLHTNVTGMGSNGGRLGTNIWPEENFILLLYLEQDECETLFEKLKVIKDHFPDEGIKIAVSDVEMIL